MLQRMIAIALIGYSILLLQSKPAASSVEAPAGTQLLLEATGDGSQIYTCTEGHWTLKAPDARLLDAQGQVIGNHFAGPTWHLQDGSEIKGKAIANQPAKDASSIPWLLVQAVPGSGTGQLAKVAYIRRTETSGGAADSGACTTGEEKIPYKAKYSFYTAK
jgi:Protein of unknown function (DUF3455)